ncbi:MAG: single-stranded DNA-binding protein [Eubacteriales bacterium]
MEKNWNQNQILLHGKLCHNPCYSHCSHGTEYYVFPFAVARLSGATDQVKIIAAESLQYGLCCGDTLTIAGEVRSFNKQQNGARRLIITVHANEIIREDGEDANQLKLAGTLCKPPIYRRTPLGRDICDMMLAVNRSYGRTDYLPCISWGALAQRCGEYTVGTALTLEGRLQSRIYTKKFGERSEERTAFEISVAQIELLQESVKNG